MSETARNDALKVLAIGLSDHRVCLSAAGLSVGENCAIVPLKNMFYQGEGGFTINYGLLGGLCEYSIIGKTFYIIRLIRFC